ncbi:MAG: DNA polymerase III subunit gamma/tau [Methyloligella sp.]|nr:MAG: DNA polymerase III subunit gamma/tau [Methyloligella sp.]
MVDQMAENKDKTSEKKPSKAQKTSKSATKSKKSDQGAAQDPYLVLARKYRPADFSDLIGQEPMVQTLRNAFESNRIAQGFMLSGVRGVGKTTTARILARALNFETETINSPTIDMTEEGTHCPAIMAGSHVDVMEMDAASHTGIDDIREIIEAARYKPVSARYKVYIIDEVHMLSKSAFNGLLKTLEEPPAHVKFIFATTELRKVPVTVLSRCQRFDLRRIDIRDLEQHFANISKKEDVKIDEDAISLIARAAEGSVRDGLSLLDQAFARADENSISADNIRSMLGLADQAEILGLLGSIFAGNAPEALNEFRRFYDNGGDPQQIISDMAEAVHIVTRTKALSGGNTSTESGQVGNDDLPEAAKAQIIDMAGKLSMAVLSRGWQTLLKGYEEIGKAPNQVSAAEMIIMRLLYMSDLPAPGDVIAALKKAQDGPVLGSSDSQNAGQGGQPSPDGATASSIDGGAGVHTMTRSVNGPDMHLGGAPEAEQITAPHAENNQLPTLETFSDVLELIGEKRDVKLKLQLEEYAELVRFAPGSIELHLLDGATDGLAGDLTNKLSRWTGARWMVALSHERGEQTIGSQRRVKEQKELEQIQSHPSVQGVIQNFPGAEIVSIKPMKSEDEQN